jgi:DNA polymerase-3 subunit chi
VTVVAFHFGATDKLAYVCRLLRKAVGSGSAVMVLTDRMTQQKLDVDLWAISATDFLVHCLQTSDTSMQRECPVLLTTELNLTMDAGALKYPVLLNLTETVPHGFQAFPRVIEVVSTDTADRTSARSRWRRYAELGCLIARHDLAIKGAN